jgi:hypothetical protein
MGQAYRSERCGHCGTLMVLEAHAMNLLSTGDVFLTVAIVAITFLIEIGVFMLVGII